jgi:hypothetical protein
MERYLEQAAAQTTAYYLSSIHNEKGDDGFVISIVSRNDFAAACLKTDLNIAKRCFDLLAAHSVMPCTLHDILEDLSVPHDMCVLLGWCEMDIKAAVEIESEREEVSFGK